MSKFYSIYNFVRLLSLDVVLGACICSKFVANYLQVDIQYSILIALAMGVWLIYTGDHLIDAHNTKHIASSFRHRFHQKYFKAIAAVWVCVLAVSVFPLLYLPLITIKWGVILTISVIVYYLSLQLLGVKWGYVKEIAIAVIYSIGIFLGPATINPNQMGTDLVLMFLFFVFIAFINLLLFSLYERKQDCEDDYASMPRLIGDKNSYWLIVVATLSASFVLIAHSYMYPNPKSVAILLAIMLITLISIAAFRPYFSLNERYRILGDAIFIFPVIGIWI